LPSTPDSFDAPFVGGRDGLQFSATELLEAVSYLRELDADQRPFDVVQLCEEGSDDALADALEELYAVA